MAMLNRPASEFDANYESRCCGPGSVNWSPKRKWMRWKQPFGFTKVLQKKKKKRLSSVYPIKIQGGVTVPVESVNRKEP